MSFKITTNRHLIVRKMPTIAFIGRPNVGKSTIFNLIARRRISIVNKKPGSTIDRKYALIDFLGFQYRIIDTSGLISSFSDDIHKKASQQTRFAINEADVVAFIVDAKDGLLPSDIEIALELIKLKVLVILVVNKCDSEKIEQNAYEFYSLIKAPLVKISAAQGLGISLIFSEIKLLIPQLLKKKELKKVETLVNHENNNVVREIKVSIVGRPNVGKSTFINKILNEDRLLVSNIPGTTIDTIDVNIVYKGQKYLLIDTAGIRKKRSIFQDLEKQAVSASLKALDRSIVSLFLIDAREGIKEQDLKIASFIEKKSNGSIILVNKWDLCRSNKLSQKVYIKQIRSVMPFLSFAPIFFTSALNGEKIFEALNCVKSIAKRYYKRISTSQVNKWLKNVTDLNQPGIVNGRRLKFTYGIQVSVAPPVFMIVCNEPKKIHFSYSRYLINKLRECFTFIGVPLRIVYHSSKKVKTIF